jgi:hypothetical protein
MHLFSRPAAGFLIALLVCLSGAAQASVIINVDQIGANVVATASGTIDLTGLTYDGLGGGEAFIRSESTSAILAGNPSMTDVDCYQGITGPDSFGSGVDTVLASSGGVVDFGFDATYGLWLPFEYSSGAALSATSTWNDQTLASLGLTPGTYTYTWGEGAHADSLVLQIGPAAGVPEPASWSLAAGAAGLIAMLRRRRAQSR